MSHNVQVDGVEFRDLAVLEKAAAELLRESELQGQFVAGEGARMRGWMGRTTPVDAVIKLPNEQYDIGFTKNADGTYVPFFESGFRARGFAADHGSLPLGDQSNVPFAQRYHGAQNIGKLVARYSVMMAERNAAKAGMRTRRMVDKAKGQIRLEVFK